MKCYECDHSKMKKEVRENHPYECGIANVRFEKLTVFVCPDCGAEYEAIPKLGPLMDELAKAVLTNNNRLSGEELRFLRDYVGFTRQDVADQCGVHRSTVHRWEAGKLDAAQDKLFRFIILAEARRLAGEVEHRALSKMIQKAKLEAGVSAFTVRSDGRISVSPVAA